MSASVYKTDNSSSGAVSFSVVVPTGQTYRLNSVTINIDSSPITSENVAITLSANSGHTVLLYDSDLLGVPNTVWGTPLDIPDMRFIGGDSIDVAYTNTDANTVNTQVTMERVI